MYTDLDRNRVNVNDKHENLKKTLLFFINKAIVII